jgi:glycosyltransferase involved in cell wall biosynthesis
VKSVLVITYVFPPSAWVGGHRTLKYCKYLGRHGWLPVVLTAKPRGVTFTDHALVAQIPADVEVHRTFDFDPAKLEERLGQRKLERIRAAAAASADAPTVAAVLAAQPRASWQRMKRFIKVLLKESPDSHIFWAPFAFLRGVYILLTRRIDVIYSTSPPHSTHLIAVLLAKVFRKPYVIDFRDPWYVTGSVREPRDKVPALLKLETRTKRFVVRNAAHIITVSSGEQAELRAEYPEIDPGRISFITNGFDPVDFPATQAGGPATSRKLTLIHTGTIYPEVADEFFASLQCLLRKHPEDAAGIEVRLVGEIFVGYTDTVQELAEAGIVKNLGLQPHAKTLGMMRESDVLVILMGGQKFRKSHLPSKAFEYLFARKSILAIAPEGELSQMVEKSGLGRVQSPESVERIVGTLRELYREHSNGGLRCTANEQFINSFDRESLAASLAAVLDTTAARPGVRAG